jgi:GT2 family glycosyltransferase
MTTGSTDLARPAVAIIFVSWNSWRHSIECIDSVLAQKYPNVHIFVIDNDSADRSVENIAAWCAQPRAEPTWKRHQRVHRYTDQDAVAPIGCRVVARQDETLPPAAHDCRVTIVRSGANLGYAGGCNVGIRAAGVAAFDYFWFLNTDTVVQRDALELLIQRAQQDPRIGMVGSTLRYYDRPEIVQCMGGARMDFAKACSHHIGQGRHCDEIPADAATVERELAYIFGASMLVLSRFIREVGLMQEDYFLYYEEIDWALRGRDRFTLAYAAQSHIFHKSGASSSKVKPSFTTGLYYRNRIRFMSRFFPEHLPAARRGLIGELVRFTLKGNWAYARIVASVLWNARRIALGARNQVGATPSV